MSWEVGRHILCMRYLVWWTRSLLMVGVWKLERMMGLSWTTTRVGVLLLLVLLRGFRRSCGSKRSVRLVWWRECRRTVCMMMMLLLLCVPHSA